MPLNQRCPQQGHLYDGALHSSCPHCGIPDLELGPTVPKRPQARGADPVNREVGKTAPANAGGRREPDDGKTIGIVQKKLGVDPVVGWLVCVEGPDRGRDYRVRSGRNFIGRSEQMHISIAGDPAVSREKHAAVSYDPKQARFKLLSGDGSGLTYLNQDTVDVPVELKPYDTIEIGETKLMFVPFCGEHFRWSGAEAPEDRSA